MDAAYIASEESVYTDSTACTGSDRAQLWRFRETARWQVSTYVPSFSHNAGNHIHSYSFSPKTFLVHHKHAKTYACGTCPSCLFRGGSCGFHTLLGVSVATHVTARDVRVI